VIADQACTPLQDRAKAPQTRCLARAFPPSSTMRLRSSSMRTWWERINLRQLGDQCGLLVLVVQPF